MMTMRKFDVKFEKIR